MHATSVMQINCLLDKCSPLADASHTTVPVLSVASDTSSQIVSGFAAPVNMVKTETYSKPIGKTPRGSGIDADQLPGRYDRKPLEDVEMQYIMVSKLNLNGT